MSDTSTQPLQFQHGGNLSLIQSQYPHAPTPLIDLSTCINPYGYPLPLPQPQWHHQLADCALMHNAHQAACEYFNAGKAVNVALAAGMQPLMVALASIRLKQAGRCSVALLSPSYSEHERIWSALGHDCQPFSEFEQAKADVVIVCNPNNPDARMIAPEKLLHKAQQLQASGGWLIVDESFADIMPEASIVAAASSLRGALGDEAIHLDRHATLAMTENVIVLRSFGKFFGVAGLRVSAAVACEAIISQLRVLVGPWPISTYACHQLPAILADRKWVTDMRNTLHSQAQAWRDTLAKHFTLVGYTDLFVLVETDNAERWFHHLASQGILVRTFDYNKRWLRLGLPHEQHLERIAQAFKS